MNSEPKEKNKTAIYSIQWQGNFVRLKVVSNILPLWSLNPWISFPIVWLTSMAGYTIACLWTIQIGQPHQSVDNVFPCTGWRSRKLCPIEADQLNTCGGLQHPSSRSYAFKNFKLCRRSTSHLWFPLLRICFWLHPQTILPLH